MADEADAAWMIQTRERLRGRVLRILNRVRQQWHERGDETRSRWLSEKCLEIEPLVQQPTPLSQR
jgi:hypothetical protein